MEMHKTCCSIKFGWDKPSSLFPDVRDREKKFLLNLLLGQCSAGLKRLLKKKTDFILFQILAPFLKKKTLQR